MRTSTVYFSLRVTLVREKSVVLSSTFNTIQDLSKDKGSKLYGTENYLLVNHQEMLKTYKEISETLPNLKKKNFMKPTSFINRKMSPEKAVADIVFVDEAHLLLSKKDSYNNFNQDNHLEEIIKQSKITIVVYDRKQVLKFKSYWDDNLIDHVKRGIHSEVLLLTNQFRIRAEEEILNWMDAFTNKQVLPLPKSAMTARKDSFELEIFSDAGEMYKKIQQKK
ncbi:DNA/RNA helicase domain-containing protein [Listeria cornellensis]|uniref:DNA/RNA helicase domain-containing protein n=1 Tax=Listeria cornellensis TaxID=1494961 RepID=UPI0024096C0E|nr:DNA/RNA helicase domain-containing protein [Listeria cornellensis]